MTTDSPLGIVVLTGSIFGISLVALMSLWESRTGEATRWSMGAPMFWRKSRSGRLVGAVFNVIVLVAVQGIPLWATLYARPDQPLGAALIVELAVFLVAARALWLTAVRRSSERSSVPG